MSADSDHSDRLQTEDAVSPPSPIRNLCVEDNDGDYALLKEHIREAEFVSPPELTRAISLKEATPLPDVSDQQLQLIQAEKLDSRGRLAAMLAIFNLGDELLAVEASAVQEITLMAQLSKASGLPALIAGFLNVARRPIPIIRLDRLLRLPESALGLYTQILIVRETAGTPVGWVVDRVTQIIPVRQEDILPVPDNHCFRNCAKGVLAHNDSSISILAPDRVLLEQERRCIVEFQAREQERIRELQVTGP